MVKKTVSKRDLLKQKKIKALTADVVTLKDCLRELNSVNTSIHPVKPQVLARWSAAISTVINDLEVGGIIPKN